MRSRPILAASIALFAACLVACSGGTGGGGGVATGPQRVASGTSVQEPENESAQSVTPLAPALPDPALRKRRGDAWMEDQHAKADALAMRVDALGKRLAEREATYKRRVDAGGLDGGTRDEIVRLKKELEAVLHDQVIAEEALADGPPESILAGESPATTVAAIPDPPLSTSATPRPSAKNPTTSSTPGDFGSSGPVSGAGKTVQVSGYTRRDGTYVAPHVRSAPRR